MKSKFCLLVVILNCIFFYTASAQIPPKCGHCSEIANDVNEACKALGQTGGVIIVREPNGQLCYCNCSCLAFFTPVEIDRNTYKKIGEVKVGDTIMSLDKDKKWVRNQVIFSGGTEDSTYTNPYMIYVKTEDNAVLISTPDHLFWMPDGSLRRADRLTASDRLMNNELKPVRIIELSSGSYTGRIHHVATGMWDTANIETDNHLISTFGIISGDYYLQLYHQDLANRTLPQLGTAANKPKIANPSIMSFIDNNTSILVKKPNSADAKSKRITTKAKEINDGISYSFKPNVPVKDPADAVYFIEPGLDSSSVQLFALDNTIPYEMAVYLEDHFRTFYPRIEYRIAWADDRVNAFASREGNKWVVTLLGGLIRHPYMQIEGVGLVLAHEIGHHLGGPPYYSGSWASCEGQADYWGAKVAMRKVWWGTYAIEQLEKGSVQVYNLFTHGLKAGNLIEIDNLKKFKANEASNMGICTHPPAQCRLDTYRSAIYLAPKPACAGFLGK